MNKPQNESKETNTSISRVTFDKFIEPAAIITIVVAATYYIGQTYINSYYGRLGLDTSSLEFPTSFYVQQSAIPVSIGVIAIYLSFSFAGEQRYKSNRRNALLGNILPLLVGLLILYVSFQQIEQDRIRYIVIAIIVLAATLILTYKGVSFSQSIKSNFLFRLGVLVAVFALFVLTAQVLGNNQAITLISGDYRKTLSVRFTWKDTKDEAAPQELNTDLILIIRNKGNYYVVKKQALNIHQPNVFPEIYMIPEGNIRFAALRNEVR